MTLVQACPYEPPHEHEFPDDWFFGGPLGTDPRADERWTPAVYMYRDDHLIVIHHTSVPFCDDEAIDKFTEVAGYGPGYNPIWLQVKRPGERDFHTIPVKYNAETDEVYDT